MNTSNPLLSVEWEKPYSHTEGRYINFPEGSNSQEFVTPYDAQKERAERVIQAVCDLSATDLFDKLVEIHDLGSNLSEHIDGLPGQETEVRNFLFGDAIQSSTLLLVSSAIQTAKQEPGHKLLVSDEEWQDIAFRQLDLSPEGTHMDKNWFERCSGIDEPELQRKTIGSVAAAILKSDILNQPQDIAFRGDIAKLQAIS